MKPSEKAWHKAKETLNIAWLADQIGISRSAVHAWKRVPAERVPFVAKALGKHPHSLRPDLYPAPPTPPPDPWADLKEKA